ncbi:MAG: hypothetical protein R2851_19025 [Caldilineaceae bacterium]
MILVVVGCAVIPHTSLRTLRLAAYRNRLPWIVVTALATVGYSTVDKLVAEQILLIPWARRPTTLADGVHRAALVPAAPFLLRHPTGLEEWRHGWMWPAVVALGVFASYWLILWAYQVSDRVSYVVALRQFSIVIGVALGASSRNRRRACASARPW